MKKTIALILCAAILLCFCGCRNNAVEISSAEPEVEYEHIIMDENGNVISSIPNASTDENTSSVPQENTSSGNNSSDNSSNTNGKNPVSIDYNTTVEIDICDDVIRAYLDAKTPDRQFSWLKEYSGIRYDHQSFELDWRLDASSSYTVTFSENADFSNPYILKADFTSLEKATLIPGKTYYWKATGAISNEPLGGGKIHVKDAPVRWIDIDGVGNVRDMGGWKAEGGKKVKYGMLYRGKALGSLVNNEPKIYVTENGIATIKQLGLKTELDLRYAHQKFQTPGTGMNYEFIEHPGQYDSTLKSNSEVFKASYKRVFELLSDKSNYPFYAHCNAGADRTGTFAFIVNGVLGVSYEDLTRDFELTSFSSSGKRWRGEGIGNTFSENDLVMQEDKNNTVAWGRLYKEMMEYGKKNGCTTLQQSIQHWLTSYIGVPQSQIDSFKSIVLE